MICLLLQTFTVTLTNPLGGARFQEPLTATVTILQSDDFNGVFSFAADSLVVSVCCVEYFSQYRLLLEQVIIPENNVATLIVERLKSAVGVVTVYWEVSSGGVSDLVPTNGSITFQDVGTFDAWTLPTLLQ